jgi:hypothetical protein
MVKIAPSESGDLITPTSNPNYGYMRIVEKSFYQQGIWRRSEERSSLVLGEIDVLVEMVKSAKNGELPGRIVYQDYLQSEMPDHVRKDLVGKRDEEEALANVFRRAGADGPHLTIGGERIVRYKFYDESGKQEDILLQHDNGEDIRAHQAAVATKAKKATLPAGRK